MKKEEALKRFEEIEHKLKNERFYDAENGHWEADEILIKFINDEDIKTAYEKIPKW